MGSYRADFDREGTISDQSSNCGEKSILETVSEKWLEWRDWKLSSLHGRPHDEWEIWVWLDGPGFELSRSAIWASFLTSLISISSSIKEGSDYRLWGAEKMKGESVSYLIADAQNDSPYCGLCFVGYQQLHGWAGQLKMPGTWPVSQVTLSTPCFFWEEWEVRKEGSDLPKVKQLVKVRAVTGGEYYSFFYARGQQTEAPQDRSNLSHFRKEHLMEHSHIHSFMYWPWLL